MTLRNDFEHSLSIGHKAEEFVLKKLKEEFPNLKRVYGKSIHCDLKTNDGYMVEVKLDSASEGTGNVAIEYKHRGILSGISISKAMEWVIIYYLKGTGFVYSRMKTNDLRSYLRSNWKYFDKIEGKGDMSSLILVKSTEFADRFPYNIIL